MIEIVVMVDGCTVVILPIIFMLPIPPISPLPPVSVVESDLEHPLPQASLFKKILLQSAELLIQEVVGLVNETDGDVGQHLGRAGFHELTVKLKVLRGLAAQASDEHGFPGLLFRKRHTRHH